MHNTPSAPSSRACSKAAWKEPGEARRSREGGGALAAPPELVRRQVSPVEELLVPEADGEGDDGDAPLGCHLDRQVAGAIGHHAHNRSCSLPFTRPRGLRLARHESAMAPASQGGARSSCAPSRRRMVVRGSAGRRACARVGARHRPVTRLVRGPGRRCGRGGGAGRGRTSPRAPLGPRAGAPRQCSAVR